MTLKIDPNGSKNLYPHWKNLNCETMKKLVSRMPNFCKAVIHAKGHVDESKV